MTMVNHTQQRLTTQEIIARQAHTLHHITLFSAAFCHVRQGRKTVEWGGQYDTATSQSLIVFPAGIEINIANIPEYGQYCSDMVYLPQTLLRRFRDQHPDVVSGEPPTPISLCIPLDIHTRLIWDSLLDTLKNQAPAALQQHLLQGILLALKLAGHAELLLRDRHDSLVERVQQLLLLDPARHWNLDDAAQQLHMGSSTLRRRLATEGSSFRIILEEIRMNNALNQLQTSHRPIGDIAYHNGYASASRFTARFTQRFGLSPQALRKAIHKQRAPLS